MDMSSSGDCAGDRLAGAAGPDPARVHAIRLTLRRREGVAASVLFLTIAAMAASLWTYGTLWIENRHLAVDGQILMADVARVSRSQPAPDQITVRFNTRERGYERTISSGWFSRFSSGLEGKRVPVLFDPVDQRMARLVGDTNFPASLLPSLALSTIGLAVATYFYRAIGWHAKASHESKWERARIALGAHRANDLLIRRTGDDETHRATVVLRRRPREGYPEQGAWLASFERGLVVVPDESPHWVTASIRRSSPQRENQGRAVDDEPVNGLSLPHRFHVTDEQSDV